MILELLNYRGVDRSVFEMPRKKDLLIVKAVSKLHRELSATGI
ncbi:MAG: hypothetical protein QXP02_01875 [Desulfurococcaceae archaeon]